MGLELSVQQVSNRSTARAATALVEGLEDDPNAPNLSLLATRRQLTHSQSRDTILKGHVGACLNRWDAKSSLKQFLGHRAQDKSAFARTGPGLHESELTLAEIDTDQVMCSGVGCLGHHHVDLAVFDGTHNLGFAHTWGLLTKVSH